LSTKANTASQQAFGDAVNSGSLEVEHLVADGDDVAFACTVTGSHDGPVMGQAPPGRAVKVRGVQISRFAKGLLVERWGSGNQLGLLTQIGAVPA